MSVKFPFGCEYKRERTLLAPNLWSSRDRQGFLHLDNRKIFLGYTQAWVRKDGRRCFRLHCWTAGESHFTITKNTETLAQAERLLIKYGRELRRIDALDIKYSAGQFILVHEKTERRLNTIRYTTHRAARKALRQIARGT